MSKKDSKKTKGQKSSEEHVVYSYFFPEDGATYHGRTTLDRVEERHKEHLAGKNENEPLRQRFARGGDCIFKIESIHKTEGQAKKAEDKAIKSAHNPLNVQGTENADISSPDKGRPKSKKGKKG